MGWMRRRILSARFADLRPVLDQLRHYEFLPPEDIQLLQRERLADLLRHAYRSTAYYQELLGGCGVVAPSGTVELAGFSDVPQLDKSLLRAHYEEMKSSDLEQRHWFENWSGGSTGEPARFIQDGVFDSWVTATKIQFDEWSGYRIGDRKAILWGSARDIDHQRHPFRTRAARWLSNEKWLRAFGGLSDDDMLAHAGVIEQFRPIQLLAYAESAFDLARCIERTGTVVTPPGSVMTSAGTLHPQMRKTIERALGAPVFNRYGAREVGDVACECDRHQGLHVSAPWQYVEILRPDGAPAGPGEDGELVITNLANYAMPLIRYRIGDLGSWAGKPCSCGRSWPLLARVSGRVVDMFLTSDGRRIPGGYFVFLMLDTHSWVQRYQVVQESLGRVEVYLQVRDEQRALANAQAEGIRLEIIKVMGSDCSVGIHLVDEIRPSDSGKFLHTISKVGDLSHAREAQRPS